MPLHKVEEVTLAPIAGPLTATNMGFGKRKKEVKTLCNFLSIHSSDKMRMGTIKILKV